MSLLAAGVGRDRKNESYAPMEQGGCTIVIARKPKRKSWPKHGRGEPMRSFELALFATVAGSGFLATTPKAEAHISVNIGVALFALMDTTPLLLTLALPTAITAPSGLWAASLLALARGFTVRPTSAAAWWASTSRDRFLLFREIHVTLNPRKCPVQYWTGWRETRALLCSRVTARNMARGQLFEGSVAPTRLCGLA